MEYDYRKRGGLVAKGVFFPRLEKGELTAQEKKLSRQEKEEFCLAVELKEIRKNSRLAKEVLTAIPAELPQEKQLELARSFAKRLVNRYRVGAFWAIHEPPEGGDRRNFHLHLLLTTRELDWSGTLGQKVRALDSKSEMEFLKKTWQELANEILPEGKKLVEPQKDPLAEPKLPHLGREATWFERKTGQKSRKRLEFEAQLEKWQTYTSELKELERQRRELERQWQEQEFQRELERQAELERQREQERRQAESQKKYSYFASIKKLINRYKNPQIGTDREGEILLPDQTLKFSELNSYSLESLQEVYQTTRRKIERDLDRRIGQLPPISRQIIGLCPLKELTDDGLIGLFPRVLQLEQLNQEEKQKQEAERKRQEQELERQRLEQERQQQELARAKLAKFKQTQKLLSLSGIGETGENWYRFKNLLITEGNLREFPLEELEKIYQNTYQVALKKFQELEGKIRKHGDYDERVWEITQRNLPLENKLEELLKIRDEVAERSFREINLYLGLIQQFRKDFRIDWDWAKIPKEEIIDLASDLKETYFSYADKYANLRKAISTHHLDQIVLDFLIRKFELNPSEEKLKELLAGKEVKRAGEIQRKIANSLERKFSAETGEEPKGYDFDELIWNYKVKVAKIQERLIQKLHSKGLGTSDLETSNLEQLAGQVRKILQEEREERESNRELKLFFLSDQNPRRHHHYHPKKNRGLEYD